MNLTPAQTQTFTNWLAANAANLTDQDAAGLANTPTGSSFTTSTGTVIGPLTVAGSTNPYLVWSSQVQRQGIQNAANLAQYTMPAAPASPSTDVSFLNWSISTQLKQENFLSISNPVYGPADATSSLFRGNLHDCTTNIPSGASGATVNAGWGTPAIPGAIVLAMQTTATYFEQLFVVAATGQGNNATTQGLNTNPAAYGLDATGAYLHGQVSQTDVAQARGF